MDFFPLRGGETRSVQPKTKSKRQTEAGRPKVPEWVDRLTYERFARTEDEPVWPRRRERLRKAGQGENEERARATRERVEKEFISSGHIDAVERAICATNTIVSFRAAGEATLERIRAGAAPKPHVILDKSLKAQEFGEPVEQNGTVGQMRNALAGLVPYREGNAIKGLHLSSLGVTYFESESLGFEIGQIKESGRKYLVCDPTCAKDPFVKWLLEKLSEAPDFRYTQWFVTGDYDLHDMALKISQGAPVPSDSYDEARILKALSEGIMRREYSGPAGRYLPDEFSPIQHGPQYNYIAHMKSMEADRSIVPKVADLDLRIALFDGREWTILEANERSQQAQKLQEYYESHGLKLKWIWQDTAEAREYMDAIATKQGAGPPVRQ